MKYEKMPMAEPRPRDGKTMLETVALLEDAGADVRRPIGNNSQLKLSADISYYPSTGSIVIDGEDSACSERGVAALLSLLRARGEIR